MVRYLLSEVYAEEIILLNIVPNPLILTLFVVINLLLSHMSQSEIDLENELTRSIKRKYLLMLYYYIKSCNIPARYTKYNYCT